MKKYAILALTLCMLLTSFSGCKNNNTIPQTSAPSQSEESPVESSQPETSSFVFDFTTEDINGNSVSLSDYSAEKSLIMVNFWEPWCGPCIGEMPDLEKLYQKYKDEGFLILGVYSTPNDDNSVSEAVENTGVTYPCLLASDTMYKFMTGYVPTTFFINKNGNILSSEPIIGSNPYEDWEEKILEFLK